jgi:hypothetical protein
VIDAESCGRISFKQLPANDDMWLPLLGFNKQRRTTIVSSFASTHPRLTPADWLFSHCLSFPYSIPVTSLGPST